MGMFTIGKNIGRAINWAINNMPNPPIDVPGRSWEEGFLPGTPIPPPPWERPPRPILPGEAIPGWIPPILEI